MPLDLIAAGLIIAFAGIVALGHVLVGTAIYKCLREDYAASRDRKVSSDMTTPDDDVKRAAGAEKISETLELQRALHSKSAAL
jgi:hypothetical protein